MGRRIASARLGAGYRSSAAFGAAIGKSEFTVRSYESGRINPPTAVLQKIAEVTGRSFDWIVNGVEELTADNVYHGFSNMRHTKRDTS